MVKPKSQCVNPTLIGAWLLELSVFSLAKTRFTNWAIKENKIFKGNG